MKAFLYSLILFVYIHLVFIKLICEGESVQNAQQNAQLCTQNSEVLQKKIDEIKKFVANSCLD